MESQIEQAEIASIFSTLQPRKKDENRSNVTGNKMNNDNNSSTANSNNIDIEIDNEKIIRNENETIISDIKQIFVIRIIDHIFLNFNDFHRCKFNLSHINTKVLSILKSLECSHNNENFYNNEIDCHNINDKENEKQENLITLESNSKILCENENNLSIANKTKIDYSENRKKENTNPNVRMKEKRLVNEKESKDRIALQFCLDQLNNLKNSCILASDQIIQSLSNAQKDGRHALVSTRCNKLYVHKKDKSQNSYEPALKSFEMNEFIANKYVENNDNIEENIDDDNNNNNNDNINNNNIDNYNNNDNNINNNNDKRSPNPSGTFSDLILLIKEIKNVEKLVLKGIRILDIKAENQRKEMENKNRPIREEKKSNFEKQTEITKKIKEKENIIDKKKKTFGNGNGEGVKVGEENDFIYNKKLIIDIDNNQDNNDSSDLNFLYSPTTEEIMRKEKNQWYDKLRIIK